MYCGLNLAFAFGLVFNYSYESAQKPSIHIYTLKSLFIEDFKTELKRN